MQMKTTVIIPAHNEAAVIERCLRALTDGAADGELDVIVVANGCTDGTAAVGKRFGGCVRVIETDVPSKSNALNLGDAAAGAGGVRVYLDADCVLDLASLRRLVAHLGSGRTPAVSPCVRHDLSGASWSVRAFYAVDEKMPSSRETIGGSGVYALSRAGRARFEKFPTELTADDAFVRRHFRTDERARVVDAVSIVTPPKRLAGVVAIKTRSHFGNYQIAKRYPHLGGNRGAGNRAALLRLALRPGWGPRLAVYGYVKVAARVRARARLRRAAAAGAASSAAWERDETSRQGTGSGAVTGAEAGAGAGARAGASS